MLVAGDLGGTKALLLLATRRQGRLQPLLERRYAAADYSDFAAMLACFLGECRELRKRELRLTAACFGAAGPVAGNCVQMTNLPWRLDARAIAAEFGIGRVHLVNDFEAAAAGVDVLEPGDSVELQRGEPLPQAPRVVLGAGTGLGVAYAFAQGGRWHIVAGEGGHAGFAPADEAQIRLWQALRPGLGRVSAEHVVSGPGLMRIYASLCAESAPGAQPDADLRREGAAAVSRRALDGTDPLALRALDVFLACYGALAGDHALGVLARGGVYIAGGIARQVLGRLRDGGFLSAFCAKGAHAPLMRRMPLCVVTTERLGLLGAATIAANAGRRPVAFDNCQR